MVTFHNYMVLNPGKCYNMTFTSNTNKNEFVFENCIGDNNRLPFKPYLKQLRKKIASKLNTLTIIAPYLDHNRRRLSYSSINMELLLQIIKPPS